MQKVVSVCVVRERKNRGIPDEICAGVQQKHAITYTMHAHKGSSEPVREFTVPWIRDKTSRLNKEEVGKGDRKEKIREKETWRDWEKKEMAKRSGEERR